MGGSRGAEPPYCMGTNNFKIILTGLVVSVSFADQWGAGGPQRGVLGGQGPPSLSAGRISSINSSSPPTMGPISSPSRTRGAGWPVRRAPPRGGNAAWGSSHPSMTCPCPRSGHHSLIDHSLIDHSSTSIHRGSLPVGAGGPQWGVLGGQGPLVIHWQNFVHQQYQ